MVPDGRNDRTQRLESKYCMHAAFMPAESCNRKRHDKGIEKEYPESNIVAVDYDPGASEVNQLNRIRLMLSAAFRNLNMGEAYE